MNIINFIESIFSTEDTEYTEWKSVIIRALRGRFQLRTEATAFTLAGIAA